MTIRPTTNIDFYKGHFQTFSHNEKPLPRVGDFMMVNQGSENLFRDKKLPLMLEVKRVIFGHNDVSVELHYSDDQAKALTQANIKMFP